MGAEQVRPCVGAVATLSLTSLQAEPKHPGGSTLHISPYRNMELGSVAASAASQGREGVGRGGTLNNAVQVSCGLLYQLRSKPSSDSNY